jgi:hypothetical protein
MVTTVVTTAQDAASVLVGLSSTQTPWLTLALGGPADHGRLAAAAAAGPVTVVDITDPQAPPVMINPFEPAPGYPVQAHTDRLAGLLEASFDLGEPVAWALRAGLRRAYADCGWDMRTGAGRPGTVSSPAIPAFRKVKLAIEDAATNLGYDPGMRASVRSFLEVRLDALWAGPAGLFLEGGHPADLDRLVRGNVLVTAGQLADEDAGWFLAGVLLLRLAGTLSRQGARPGAPGAQPVSPPRRGQAGRPPAVVIVAAAGRAQGSGRLLEDLQLAGADVVVAPAGNADVVVAPAGNADVVVAPAGNADVVVAPAGNDGPAVPRRPAGPWPAGASAAGTHSVGAAPAAAATDMASLLAGRRSAACGERCRRRPCTGYEVHTAGLLADDPGRAWLRLWVRTLVLAFLSGHPLPGVPAPLRRPGQLRAGGQALSPRGRECLLATVIDAAIAARAPALRTCYDPRYLAAVTATVAGRMLADGAGVPVRAGSVWVIPQLRWLHETERLTPFGRDRLRPGDIAPPLDFGLAGLPDWPGIRVADRLGGLRGHPLAMGSERNRRIAMTALLGDERAGLDADLAVASMGVSPPRRLRHAARMLGASGPGGQPGWLEVVLSWPGRLIGPVPGIPEASAAPAPDVHGTATG